LLQTDSVGTVCDGRLDLYKDAYITTVTSTLYGLRVAGQRLMVDRLHAALKSTHAREGGEPSIVFTGTTIENLVLDNFPVQVEFDYELEKYGTEREMVAAYAEGTLRGRIWETAPNAEQKEGVPRVGGYIGCSIVRKITYDNPKANVYGHIIELPGFGVIKIGELLTRQDSKRLTLLRLVLGCPNQARMVAAYVKSNGETL
jgi:hypothetical protein